MKAFVLRNGKKFSILIQKQKQLNIHGLYEWFMICGGSMSQYKILTTEGRAKRAELHTVHGVIQTPVFMNVGTAAAINGAVSS